MVRAAQTTVGNIDKQNRKCAPLLGQTLVSG